jgi:hypothetical protein
MAMCVIAVVGEAPCQCFSPGENHHIAGPDLLDRSAFALNSAATGCDNESLAEGMCVPCGSGLHTTKLATCGLSSRVEDWRHTPEVQPSLLLSVSVESASLSEP